MNNYFNPETNIGDVWYKMCNNEITKFIVTSIQITRHSKEKDQGYYYKYSYYVVYENTFIFEQLHKLFKTGEWIIGNKDRAFKTVNELLEYLQLNYE
jgi:hypothetical protein